MSDTAYSLCRELLEALKSCSPAESELIARATSFLETKGCWLDDGQVDATNLPDTCVFDEGEPHNCIHAHRLIQDGKGKINCPYWNAGAPML